MCWSIDHASEDTGRFEFPVLLRHENDDLNVDKGVEPLASLDKTLADSAGLCNLIYYIYILMYYLRTLWLF